MMRLIRSLILTLVIPSTVFAQGPKIEGPDEVSPGSLVILDATAISSSGRNWQAVNAPADSFKIVDDAQRIVFATPTPGKYWFVFSYTSDLSLEIEALADAQKNLAESLIVAEIDEIKTATKSLTEMITILVNTKVKTESIVHQVVVTGTIPNPNPDNPNPPKPTPLPEGKYGLATLSRDMALREVPEAPRTRSKDVAGVHRGIAARIAAGALKGGQEPILIALREGLVSTLGDDFEAWKPWGNSVMKAMSDLSDDGKIVNDSDFATAFSEIALGLEVIQ